MGASSPPTTYFGEAHMDSLPRRPLCLSGLAEIAHWARNYWNGRVVGGLFSKQIMFPQETRLKGLRSIKMGAQLLWHLRHYSRAEFPNASLELEAAVMLCSATRAQICRVLCVR